MEFLLRLELLIRTMLARRWDPDAWPFVNTN
jgi:hypothetical protein